MSDGAKFAAETLLEHGHLRLERAAGGLRVRDSRSDDPAEWAFSMWLTPEHLLGAVLGAMTANMPADTRGAFLETTEAELLGR